jgi:hypothetical protein
VIVMARWKSVALEVLAALCGVGLVVGETVEAVLADDDGGQDEFPGQRRGGGTHFKERVERAKVLGEFPGLRRMAAKLREPRGLAAYTPPDDGQSRGGPSTGGGTRGVKGDDEPQNEWPERRRAVPDLGGDGAGEKKDQKEWPGRRVGGGTRADGTPNVGPTQTPPPE